MNKLTLQNKKEELSEIGSHIYLLQESVKNITNWVLKEDMKQVQNLLNYMLIKSIQIQNEIEWLTDKVEVPEWLIIKK